MQKTDEEKIGELGEKLVAKLLNAEMSADKYDTEKDMMLIDGTKIEVKTQNRVKKYNEFTIREDHKNQIKKCKTVDRLFFVEYGTYGHIRIYECVDRTTKPRFFGERKMVCFDIQNMNIVFDMKHPYCDEMIKLSNSESKYLNDSHLYNKSFYTES